MEAKWNDKDAFRRSDGSYFIWWDAIVNWCISEVLGNPGTAYWYREDPTILGLYTPQGTATGDATVAVGEHP